MTDAPVHRPSALEKAHGRLYALLHGATRPHRGDRPVLPGPGGCRGTADRGPVGRVRRHRSTASRRAPATPPRATGTRAGRTGSPGSCGRSAGPGYLNLSEIGATTTRTLEAQAARMVAFAPGPAPRAVRGERHRAAQAGLRRDRTNASSDVRPGEGGPAPCSPRSRSAGRMSSRSSPTGRSGSPRSTRSCAGWLPSTAPRGWICGTTPSATATTCSAGPHRLSRPRARPSWRPRWSSWPVPWGAPHRRDHALPDPDG